MIAVISLFALAPLILLGAAWVFNKVAGRTTDQRTAMPKRQRTRANSAEEFKRLKEAVKKLEVDESGKPIDRRD